MARKIYIHDFKRELSEDTVSNKMLKNMVVSNMARMFSNNLHEELGDTFFELAEQSDPTSDTCNMHDECDANMIMYATLSDCTQGIFKEATDEQAQELCNKAWTIARENKFFIESMEEYKEYKLK